MPGEGETEPQNNQSAGPVSFLIFCSKVFSCWLARWQVEDPSRLLVQISRVCTPPYLSTGISNLLQPAQAEVVLGQRSTYLASWDRTIRKMYYVPILGLPLVGE
jgi:hypothetical protein